MYMCVKEHFFPVADTISLGNTSGGTLVLRKFCPGGYFFLGDNISCDTSTTPHGVLIGTNSSKSIRWSDSCWYSLLNNPKVKWKKNIAISSQVLLLMDLRANLLKSFLLDMLRDWKVWEGFWGPGYCILVISTHTAIGIAHLEWPIC